MFNNKRDCFAQITIWIQFFSFHQFPITHFPLVRRHLINGLQNFLHGLVWNSGTYPCWFLSQIFVTKKTSVSVRENLWQRERENRITTRCLAERRLFLLQSFLNIIYLTHSRMKTSNVKSSSRLIKK